MKGKKYLAVGAILVLSLEARAPVATAQPTEITTCLTITTPGSYVLNNNLTALGDCLVVATNFVTINLNGFSIKGNGTGSGIKGNGTSRIGITVHDGTIRRFVRGIDFASEGIQIHIERMRLVKNSGTGAGANELAIVKDSLFSENGVGLVVGSRSVVTGNTARGNTDGIQVGSGSTIIGNTSGVNSRDGFQLDNGSTIVNNTAHSNTRFGLVVQCPSNLLGNTAMFNGTNVSLDTTLGTCNTEHNLIP